MITLMSTGPDWTQTVIRLIPGMVFFAHAAEKLKGWIAGASLTETLRGNDVGVLWRRGPHSWFTQPRRRARIIAWNAVSWPWGWRS